MGQLTSIYDHISPTYRVALFLDSCASKSHVPDERQEWNTKTEGSHVEQTSRWVQKNEAFLDILNKLFEVIFLCCNYDDRIGSHGIYSPAIYSGNFVEK